jgi:hypothetical protein
MFDFGFPLRPLRPLRLKGFAFPIPAMSAIMAILS